MNLDHNPPVGGGGTMFLRLKDGEAVKVIPRGENKVFYVKWNGSASEEVDRSEPGAKFRFKFNVVMNEGGKYVAKIFENGPSLYNALKELAEDYDLEKTVIKIKREGSGLETRYHAMPMPTQLGEDQLAAIAAVELPDLDGKKDQGFGPSFDEGTENPF